MSPAPSSRSSPNPSRPSRPPTGPPPVTDPVAALRLVLTVASQPPRFETVCLLLDRSRRPVGGVVVVGRGEVVAVGDTMLLLAAPDPNDRRRTGGHAPSVPDIAAVVLATVQPGAGHRPGPAERSSWSELCRRFEAEGVELVDWFLVDGASAGSMAELTDRASRWQP